MEYHTREEQVRPMMLHVREERLRSHGEPEQEREQNSEAQQEHERREWEHPVRRVAQRRFAQVKRELPRLLKEQ